MHQTKQGKPPPKPLSGFQKDQYRKPSLSTPKKSPKKYDGPVYVPAEVYKLLSPQAIVALRKHNTEAINRFAKKRGFHVTEMIDHESHPPEDTTHDAEAQSIPHQFDNAPESEDDPILDYINSQYHQDEDMSNALQAYSVMTSAPPDDTPQLPINSTHTHLSYHVSQAKQAQHGSRVDRGANGGLAGSDVRILSKSSMKCTVTGIDQHQINGLDMVQCAALANSNHASS